MNSNMGPPPPMTWEQDPSASPGNGRAVPQRGLTRQISRAFDHVQPMQNPWNREDTTTRFASQANGDRYNLMGSAMQPSEGYSGYEFGASQSWNPNAFSTNHVYNAQFTAPPNGTTGRIKPGNRGRAPIPNTWMDHGAMGLPNPMSNALTTFNGGVGQPLSGSNPLTMRNDFGMSAQEQLDDELIPTAIVIKNIPFAVKKEQLVDLMNHHGLPIPYAFNYHFDNGVFRGLAFANFTSPDETRSVIQHLNGYELQGRKLRVEYKKMLPIQERERIEREKRERRGQLEEQHRPIVHTLQTQASASSLASHLPGTSPSPALPPSGKHGDIDLNDPNQLSFYTELIMFKNDPSREALIFPSALSPTQRRVVHTLAHLMGLGHISRGNGEQRQVHVYHPQPGSNTSPPLGQGAAANDNDPNRRLLNRSATSHFGDARGNEVIPYGANILRGQQSLGLLGVPESPAGFNVQQNLRPAKSYMDLRTSSPSPAPSSSSFPQALQSNVARLQEVAPGSQASSTPTLTPTASASTIEHYHSEGGLINGFSSMSLSHGTLPGNNNSSPRRLRGVFSWDNDTPTTRMPPIGSNRNFSSVNAYRDHHHESGPARQPRGPGIQERSNNFMRRGNANQGRSSDELPPGQHPEILVE